MLTVRLYKLLRSAANLIIRTHHVCVLGGTSEIGQVVSMMLRAEPSVSRLVVHDLKPGTAGVVQDLSHMPVHSGLSGYCGADTLDRALKQSDIVLLTGGATTTPGLAKPACLEASTEFLKTVAPKVGKMSPMPFVGVAMDPINMLVPMTAELMRYHGAYDPARLFGVTTIDWLRAQTLYAKEHNLYPQNCFVPVIGGRSDRTTIPLLSHRRPVVEMKESAIMNFTTKIRNYDDIVTQAKLGFSPTLSIAYSVLIFTRQLLSALEGRPAQVCAFIENNDYGTSYFSGLVSVDKVGIKSMQRYINLTEYESHLLDTAIEQLRKDVAQGQKILEKA